MTTNEVMEIQRRIAELGINGNNVLLIGPTQVVAYHATDEYRVYHASGNYDTLRTIDVVSMIERLMQRTQGQRNANIVLGAMKRAWLFAGRDVEILLNINKKLRDSQNLKA